MLSGPRPTVGSAAEPIFLHALDGAYRGGLPAFYDAAGLAAGRRLAAEFHAIRKEALRVLADEPAAFTTNFEPNGYRNTSFRTCNLMTDGRRYHRNRARLPVTTAICDSLPGISTAQVGVLGPGCELPEHCGDSNMMFRFHLPLVVPAGLPHLGINVGGHDRAWCEGEVLAFEDAHRHRVWNHTDSPRVILLVDVVKDELVSRAGWIRAQAGAGILLQVAQARLPALRRAPRSLRRALHLGTSAAVRAAEPIQHMTWWRPALRRQLGLRGRAEESSRGG